MFAALAVCRFAHYAAALMLFGGCVFVLLLAPAALRLRLERSAWSFGLAAALIVLATAAVWLLLESGMMADDWRAMAQPGTISAVLFDTQFGRAWQVHGAFGLALLIALASRRPWLTCGASAFVLASLGLIGHAGMHAGLLGWLHRANLALHLLSGGFWLGGLLPLLAAMRLAQDPELRGAAVIALRRFSAAGHAAVAAVVLTGAGNAALILGPGLFDQASVYRSLLLTKIAAVALMGGLALANRYGIVPRLRCRPGAARLLMRNSMLEIGLGGVAIGLVSVFGLLDPYR